MRAAGKTIPQHAAVAASSTAIDRGYMDYFSSTPYGRGNDATRTPGRTPAAHAAQTPGLPEATEAVDNSVPLTPLGNNNGLRLVSSARYLRTPTTPGPSTVRLRRLQSTPRTNITFPSDLPAHSGNSHDESAERTGRRRSTSAPQPPHAGFAERALRRQKPSLPRMSSLNEESSHPGQQNTINLAVGTGHGGGRFRSGSNASRGSRGSRNSHESTSTGQPQSRGHGLSSKRNSRQMPDTVHEYDSDVVDLLDVVGMSTHVFDSGCLADACRPGSLHSQHSQQRPKLALRARSWSLLESPSNIYNHTPAYSHIRSRQWYGGR